jgi:hypothetical protein
MSTVGQEREANPTSAYEGDAARCADRRTSSNPRGSLAVMILILHLCESAGVLSIFYASYGAFGNRTSDPQMEPGDAFIHDVASNRALPGETSGKHALDRWPT